MEGSKQRIFRAAEALVAERGFDAVSSRDITSRAGANLAAINYHYGSKTALLLAIFRERAAELNAERLALLRAAVARDPADVRGILRALVEPSTLWSSDARRTALLFLNRARSEGPPEIAAIIRTDVRHLSRFADALATALPRMQRAEVIWRLHFALGVLHHNNARDYERLAILSDGACDLSDREALRDRLLDFMTAGF